MARQEESMSTNRLRELLFTGGVAVGIFVIIYVIAVVDSNGYFGRLMMRRGWFQYANTIFFALGAALVLGSWLRTRLESRHVVKAERVAERLGTMWRERLRASQHVANGNLLKEEEPGDQGKEVLQVLHEEGFCVNYTEEDPSACRLKDEHADLYLQRIHRLGRYLYSTKGQNLVEMTDMNRDLSSLEAEQLEGQFSFVKYLIYIMPVIGFLGTVWGISQALGEISLALPHIKELGDFTDKLGGATAALQMAFETTLLALIYSGALTLILTLGRNRTDEFMQRLDTWVIDHLFCYVQEHNPTERILREVNQTLRAGFHHLLGQSDGQIYRGGLGQIHDVIAGQDNHAAAQILQALQGMGGHLESAAAGIGQIRQQLVDADASSQHGRLLEQMRQQLERAAAAVESIGQNSAAGRQDLHRLAGAFDALSNVAGQLNAAAGRMAGMADNFASLGDLTGDLSAVRGALSDGQDNALAALTQVRDALQTTVRNDDGQSVHIDTVTGVHDLRNALGEQMAEVTRQNAEQIRHAIASVNRAIDLIPDGLNNLQRAFLKLADQLQQQRT